jgi:hypothetical protein
VLGWDASWFGCAELCHGDTQWQATKDKARPSSITAKGQTETKGKPTTLLVAFFLQVPKAAT